MSSLKDRSVELKKGLFEQSAEADGFSCLLGGAMNIHEL